jgi:hypothetical protein
MVAGMSASDGGGYGSEPGSEPAALSVRLLAESDAEAVCSLFATVFGHDLGQAQWRWKYRRPDAHAVGVFRGGELVGHYGGLGARIVCKGLPATAIQIVDVMVNPSVRHAVRKHSPFFLAASTFLEHFVGYEAPYLLGYGFPSDRHLRLAAHLGLYAPVGRMQELSWPCTAARGTGWRYRLQELDAGTFAAESSTIDALWEALRHDLRQAIVVEKTAAWIEQRYLRNPARRYRLFLLRRRFSGQALGFFVLKQEAERMQLMDCLASLEHLPLLLSGARALAQEAGCSSLYTWCPGAFVERFPREQLAQQALPISIPANIWTPGPAPATLQEHWWLLPGDTDFL